MENRIIEQKKVYDENGRLKYVVIPNYKKRNNFVTKSEVTFYKLLIRIVVNIQEKYNKRYEVFPQVALNRIIEQNNRREKEIEKSLFGKSIDYVIYDKESDDIICCIELDGSEHETSKERLERDKIINEALENVEIKLIRQKVQTQYDIDKIENEIYNIKLNYEK